VRDSCINCQERTSGAFEDSAGGVATSQTTTLYWRSPPDCVVFVITAFSRTGTLSAVGYDFARAINSGSARSMLPVTLSSLARSAMPAFSLVNMPDVEGIARKHHALNRRTAPPGLLVRTNGRHRAAMPPMRPPPRPRW